MVKINELTNYVHQLLHVDDFKDYCPNGLQVEGKSDINKIVSGVTASMALLVDAKKANADLILVHHGYFWRNENPCVVGLKRNRLMFLLENQLNLAAYHLPLDAHAALGNNAQLGQKLEFTDISFTGESNMIAYANLSQSHTLAELAKHIELKLARVPLVVGDLNKRVQQVAWCTGAAQGYIDQAIAMGADVFISGEISEQTTHQALESNVSYISAGHHATERYGVQALGEHLAEKFNLSHEFIDIHNPV